MHILDNDKHRRAPLCVYAIFASKYKIQMSFLFTYLLPYLLTNQLSVSTGHRSFTWGPMHDP